MTSSIPEFGQSLLDRFPALSEEWHPTKNGSLLSSSVRPGSSKKVWWLGKCGHEWDLRIADRVKYSTGCPFCKGNLRVMPGINDFGTLQPALSSEWHPSKNSDLVPSDIREFSMKKIWWSGSCGHEWVDTAAHRSFNDESWFSCGMASNKKRPSETNNGYARFR